MTNFSFMAVVCWLPQSWLPSAEFESRPGNATAHLSALLTVLRSAQIRSRGTKPTM